MSDVLKGSIQFGIDKPTPYFQVGDEHRIRFGYERMKGSLIKQIITETYSNDSFNMEFLLRVIIFKLKKRI